ncbi:MAG: DUF1592 domain-containing protein [Candidatus Hydrogenedentes bacterium]|nr:DUF1592 domain-containing protein [Candidatus Hydrogenedentota bacterium]
MARLLYRFAGHGGCALVLCVWLAAAGAAAESMRAQRGLLVLYDFQEGGGEQIHDRAGVGRPADLRIQDPEAVRWAGGALEVHGATLIRTEKLPVKVVELARRGGEISIEAWVEPAAIDQQGPARIVTVSGGSSARNVTLGQDGARYDVRLRTSETNGNGIPSHRSEDGAAEAALSHVVYTRDRDGRARIYVNGEERGSGSIGGDIHGWDPGYHLALGNEMSKDRGWRGVYHLVAIYSRALAPDEIAANFEAGPDYAAPPPPEGAAGPESSFFATRVAPVLAKHCLECHDTSARKGGLDLSRRGTAFADPGTIVPGNAAESLLWKEVEGDFMPDGRPPLSPEEKAVLQRWIGEGAAWSLDLIDPVVYSRGGGAEQNWIRRLTAGEYIASVASATGADIAAEAGELLPPDSRADGFSNTAYNLGVDLAHVSAFSELATAAVSKMDFSQFLRRILGESDLGAPTIDAFITGAGEILLRGPLTGDEVRGYRGIADTVLDAGGDHPEAARYIVEAMLQAPRFLYRMEHQRGDGYPWPADSFELAARLSYTVWGAPPDAELLAAADAGTLHDRGARNAQVERMLADPRARARASEFAAEWLNLGHLDHLRPSPERFPNWDPALAADMRAETLAFFDEVAWVQGRPLADLFNAKVTFATPRLAAHYGLEPRGDGLTRYDLAARPERGGLLTQGSLLALGGDGASTVTRGLFVMHHILRGAVNDPPPGLDTAPVPPAPGQPRRAIAEERVASSSCGGCHARFEPLSYALERYDGVGAYSEIDEHGNALRQDGEVLFPGEAAPAPYASTAAMMDLLAESDRVKKTITWKLAQFAMGRPLAALDAPAVEAIHEEAWREGGTYASLVRAIVSSDLVLMTRTEEVP